MVLDSAISYSASRRLPTRQSGKKLAASCFVARPRPYVQFRGSTRMSNADTVTPYDSWAHSYDSFRRPSPVVVDALRQVLEPASRRGRILSAGCGTGQYEEALGIPNVVGLDKSPGMLRIARTRIPRCVLADMRELPFGDGSCAGVCFIQSLHHVGNNFRIGESERIAERRRALQEAFRVMVAGPVAIVQRDPSQNEAVWFWRYFPKALERKLVIQPRIDTVMQWLEDAGFACPEALPLDDPMIKGFYDPRAPLDPGFRKSFSEFSYLSDQDIQDGIRQLQRAVESGSASAAIQESKHRFAEIGGTVFLVTAEKPPESCGPSESVQ